MKLIILLFMQLSIFLLYASEFQFSQENRAIIDTVLSFQLQKTDAVSTHEIEDIRENITKKVREANYFDAIRLTMIGLEKYPHSFGLQADLASLFGDSAEIAPVSLKGRMSEKAKLFFETLDEEVNNQPKELYFEFKNEYYFRNAKYLKQYELGKEIVNYYWGTDKWVPYGIRGYYSQGVGAAHYAKLLIKEGNKLLKAMRKKQFLPGFNI